MLTNSSRPFLPAICAGLLLTLTACATLSQTGSARVNGDPVSYSYFGGGSPVIVLQSGLGDGRNTWSGIVENLRNDHAVFAFDRPGYGASATTTRPRDPCTVASETHELLQAAGAKPPYLLVGHSLGGLYQYAFARMYPGEVSGLVLLDPTHPRHWETLQREAPQTTAKAIPIMKLVFNRLEQQEFDQMSACNARLDVSLPLGLPTRILISTHFDALEGPDFQRALAPLREDWRRLTGAAALQTVDTGHYIHREAPAVVLKAIREYAEASR